MFIYLVSFSHSQSLFLKLKVLGNSLIVLFEKWPPMISGCRLRHVSTVEMSTVTNNFWGSQPEALWEIQATISTKSKSIRIMTQISGHAHQSPVPHSKSTRRITEMLMVRSRWMALPIQSRCCHSVEAAQCGKWLISCILSCLTSKRKMEMLMERFQHRK